MIRIEKRGSEISGRDLQKPFGELKTANSLQDDKCYVTKDILTHQQIGMTPT
jgi:hypothetical protein